MNFELSIDTLEKTLPVDFPGYANAPKKPANLQKPLRNFGLFKCVYHNDTTPSVDSK